MNRLTPYFTRAEFACPCGCNPHPTVDAALLMVLMAVREHFAGPVRITSGYRCLVHNATLPGTSPMSYHCRNQAADIVVDGIAPAKVADYLEHQYPDQLGIGRYAGHTHVDVRPHKSRWRAL